MNCLCQEKNDRKHKDLFLDSFQLHWSLCLSLCQVPHCLLHCCFIVNLKSGTLSPPKLFFCKTVLAILGLCMLNLACYFLPKKKILAGILTRISLSLQLTLEKNCISLRKNILSHEHGMCPPLFIFCYSHVLCFQNTDLMHLILNLFQCVLFFWMLFWVELFSWIYFLNTHC